MAIFKSTKEQTAEIPPLLNPPVVETIFELRWELLGDQQTGRMRDPAYPMMYGRLFERMKKDFPIIEDLPSIQVHPEANPYVVRHRLRKEKNGWPLVQVGPGIITVNDAKGYAWKPFKALILRLVEAIVELYPAGSNPLNFIKAEVRYVNGVQFDPQKESPLGFLAEKMHTKIELSPDLFSMNPMGDKPIGLGLNLAYPLNQPVGNFGLSVNLGQVDQKPAYIIQSLIQSFGETVPHDKNGFEHWLNDAHSVAVNAFLSLFKGSLMQKFCER